MSESSAIFVKKGLKSMTKQELFLFSSTHRA